MNQKPIRPKVSQEIPSRIHPSWLTKDSDESLEIKAIRGKVRTLYYLLRSPHPETPNWATLVNDYIKEISEMTLEEKKP